MTSDSRVRAVALALTERVGWKLMQRLLEHFRSLEAILAASAEELQAVRGIGKQIAANICAANLDTTAADLKRFDQGGIHTVTWLDETYPPVLNVLDDKPLAIFWRGNNSLSAEQQAVAIVGTREPSDLS